MTLYFAFGLLLIMIGTVLLALEFRAQLKRGLYRRQAKPVPPITTPSPS